MSTLILLPYYDRPLMVRYALESVLAHSNQDWELAVCDDGSKYPAEPVVSEYFPDDERVRLYRLEDTPEQKIAQGGSRHGAMLNQAMEESSADYVIILCDDDALYPDYLNNLEKFYADHLDVQYSYGHVSAYNPLENLPLINLPRNFAVNLNRFTKPINASCNVDASQVSWRRSANIEFPAPLTAALDAVVYTRMYELWGPCVFNGIRTQYKGIYTGQMGNRTDLFTAEDINA